MKDILPFEREAIKDYLDSCISYWRERHKKAITLSEQDVYGCYIDAFQSVRSSIFGTTLPIKTQEELDG